MNQVKFKKCKNIFKSKYFAFLIQFTRFKDFVSGFRRSQHWTLNQHLTIYKSGKVIALKVLWIKINHVIMRPIQNIMRQNWRENRCRLQVLTLFHPSFTTHDTGNNKNRFPTFPSSNILTTCLNANDQKITTTNSQQYVDNSSFIIIMFADLMLWAN